MNPKDVLLRKGRFALLAGRRFPKRVGFDVAGIVRDLGPGVDRALLGARVMGFVDGWRGTRGTLAERVCIVGALGGVGVHAVQIAKLLGAHVSATRAPGR